MRKRGETYVDVANHALECNGHDLHVTRGDVDWLGRHDVGVGICLGLWLVSESVLTRWWQTRKEDKVMSGLW